MENGASATSGTTEQDNTVEPATWDHGETPAVESGVFPEDLVDTAQWHTWRSTDDGRKVPRAPYAHPEWPDKFVSAQDPEEWTEFETAREWAEKLPGHGPAFTIPDREEFPEDPYVLIDYDDARNSETGEIHPTVREHIERAGSYADVNLTL